MIDVFISVVPGIYVWVMEILSMEEKNDIKNSYKLYKQCFGIYSKSN